MRNAKYKLLFVCFTLISTLSYAQNLKLMTYNIRLDVDSDGENSWSNRKDYFASQIQFYDPDIFGVQEARPNQVFDISTALPQFNAIGIGREGKDKGESSNIYYKKDRYELKEQNTFWLSETPNQISKGWDAAYNRVCTYGLFKDIKTKKMFWVFNTHLDNIGENARKNGIDLILKKISELNAKNYPIFLMGDLNSEPNSDLIVQLRKGMNDSREISQEKPFGPSGSFNAFQHNKPVTMLIDYIFLSKNSDYKVKKYAILSDSKDLKYPSDHLPVYIEVSLK